MIKYLENDLSLLVVPIVILSRPEMFSKRRRGAFLSLLWGSFATLVICNIKLAYELNIKGHQIDSWFGWGSEGSSLTSFADSHPTYLGLFLVTSILFLIQDKKFSALPRYLLLIIFLFGLFQMVSKMALLVFVLFLFYIAVSNLRKNRQRLGVLILGISLCTAIFWVFGTSHMKSRIFSVDAVLDEKRIERWEVSYEIFRENPIFGVGFARIDEVRRTKYKKGNYSLAAAKDLNAHNQFLEYLSVNGAIGGFIYTVSIGFLFLLSLQRRDYLFAFLFFAFILANLTESMMVRIKGIEYYAIFAALFLCSGKSPVQKKKVFLVEEMET